MHTIALQQHFEEMKMELSAFGALFGGWLKGRRAVLTSDKEEYLWTLEQENGTGMVLR